jgi:hypothetical protein
VISTQAQKEANDARKLADKEAKAAAAKKHRATEKAKIVSAGLTWRAKMGADLERIKREKSSKLLATQVDPKDVKRLLRRAEDLEHLAEIMQTSL